MKSKTKRLFLWHLARNISFSLLLVALALFMGMLGYHFLENEPWIDAFVSAAMILSGMGPLHPLTSTSGKIFAGCYALFSGLVFIALMGLLFAPIIHHLIRTIHMGSNQD